MPITAAHIRSVLISTRLHGGFRLRRLAVADVEHLERLGLADLKATEYVIRVLANQLIAPQLKLEQLRELPITLLIHITRVWVRRSSIVVGKQNAATNSAEGIKAAIEAYLADWQSRRREHAALAIGSLANSVQSLGVSNIAEMVDVFQQNARITLGSIFASMPRIVLPNPSFIDALRRARVEPIVSASLWKSIGGLSDLVRPQLTIVPILRTLNNGIYDQIASLGQTFQNALNAVRSQIATDWIITSNRWIHWLAEVDEAEAEFADTGFGFADFLPISFVMRSARRDPRTRHALVTKELAAYLRSPRFEYELRDIFVRSKRLQRRWESVSSGLHGHQQRDYQKSVLTWTREVEGLFKDLLVVMGTAKRMGESYVKLNNGAVLVDKSGKPQTLEGIGSAVRHAKFDATAPLYLVAQTLNIDFRRDRNPISHGARYEYQTTKLSVQGLLLIRMLAEEIVRLEGL